MWVPCRGEGLPLCGRGTGTARGGHTGPPGDPLQTLGPFASASTQSWMRGVLGDPTRGPCRMGTGGRGRGRRCFSWLWLWLCKKKSLIR